MPFACLKHLSVFMLVLCEDFVFDTDSILWLHLVDLGLSGVTVRCFTFFSESRPGEMKHGVSQCLFRAWAN